MDEIEVIDLVSDDEADAGVDEQRLELPGNSCANHMKTTAARNQNKSSSPSSGSEIQNCIRRTTATIIKTEKPDDCASAVIEHRGNDKNFQTVAGRSPSLPTKKAPFSNDSKATLSFSRQSSSAAPTLDHQTKCGARVKVEKQSGLPSSSARATSPPLKKIKLEKQSSPLAAQTRDTSKPSKERKEEPPKPKNEDESSHSSKVNTVPGRGPNQGDTVRTTTGRKNVEDDLICPITQELLFNPVHASDGRMYEHSAIGNYIKTATEKGWELKSPYTGKPITRKLTPAPQIRNHIETLIETGKIKDDLLVDGWNQKKQEKKHRDKQVKKAEAGDVKAMEWVADGYHTGDFGFIPDRKLAYQWYERAVNTTSGSVIGMAEIGDMLLHGTGTGVRKNKNKALFYLLAAARQGSDYAAYVLGTEYAGEDHGLPPRKARDEAIHWLEKCLSGTCIYKNMDHEEKNTARETLQELKMMMSSGSSSTIAAVKVEAVARKPCC